MQSAPHTNQQKRIQAQQHAHPGRTQQTSEAVGESITDENANGDNGGARDSSNDCDYIKRRYMENVRAQSDGHGD